MHKDSLRSRFSSGFVDTTSLWHAAGRKSNRIDLKMADMERIFSAEQVPIPEELGDVLKEYTKAVIRAQPQDVLAWSAKYVLSAQ